MVFVGIIFDGTVFVRNSVSSKWSSSVNYFPPKWSSSKLCSLKFFVELIFVEIVCVEMVFIPFGGEIVLFFTPSILFAKYCLFKSQRRPESAASASWKANSLAHVTIFSLLRVWATSVHSLRTLVAGFGPRHTASERECLRLPKILTQHIQYRHLNYFYRTMTRRSNILGFEAACRTLFTARAIVCFCFYC